MDRSHHRNRSGADRPTSSRQSTRQSMDSGTNSDDDYDLHPMAVADGFRPHDISTSPSLNYHTTQSDSSARSSRQQFDTQNLAHHTPLLIDDGSKPITNNVNRPSSISKAPRPHDSLRLRNDGSSSTRPGFAPSNLSHTSCPNASAPLIQLEGPYQGPSGPSHPYDMYSQRTNHDAAATSPSVADGSYNGPRGPTHPYALYEQNTVPSEGSPTPSPSQHIPVGFNGLGNSYHRQLGPDGEEAGDLIGPLGHLEELPPYTRYPQDAYRRKSVIRDARHTTGLPMREIEGAGGLGLATRDPEHASINEELTQTRSRRSVPSIRSGSTQYEINTAAREFSEKAYLPKWQRRAKSKMWGVVPCWAICLIALGIMLAGVVMGAVIGTLLSKDDDHDTRDGSYDLKPTPTTADIQPFPTLPPNLGPLFTGSYSLPPLDVSYAPRTCFQDTTQAQSWSCEIPHRYYQIDVEPIPHAANTSNYEMTLTPIHAEDSQFIWGTQPPNVPVPMNLTLVSDNFDQGRGPAWWMKVSYNKTVTIAENEFSAAGKSYDKRNWDFPSSFFVDYGKGQKSHTGAQEGDRPWICQWPNVSLEIFIFPNQNVSIPFSPPRTATQGFGSPTPTTPDPDYPAETAALPFEPLPPYPRVIKFVERHDSPADRDDPATCRQVKIVDGEAVGLTDDDGDPVIVSIQEVRSSWEDTLHQHYRNRHPFKRSDNGPFVRKDVPRVRRDVLELTDCGCLWLST